MKDHKIYTAVDSITDTLQFDVIYTSTGDTIKVNGVAIHPDVDMIEMPSGIGFKQTLDIVEGDTIDYVVNQKINKKNISMVLRFFGNLAYQKYQSFGSWLGKYLDLNTYHIRLSWQVGSLRRYIEVSPINLDLVGREGNCVSAKLTLQPITPQYEEYDNFFTIIHDTNEGKIYNYEYPYQYGGGAYSSNNVITNDYLKPLPLKVKLLGPMAHVYVSISKIKEDGSVENTPYLKVEFESGFELTANQEVVIDAFNNKVYLNTYSVDAGGNKTLVSTTDVFNSVKKTYDSFLFAKPGNSRISAELDLAGSSCIVNYVRYLV